MPTMTTKYVVTIYTARAGVEFKATVDSLHAVLVLMERYDWVRVSIVKRNDI